MSYKRKNVSRRQFFVRSAKITAGIVATSLVKPKTLFGEAKSTGGKYDLLITGGTVVDGTGTAAFEADVAVKNGYIVKTGKIGDVPAIRKLNAKGLIVSPGFIDIHTHSDWTLLQDGSAQSAIRQGATTHVVGNCGESPAPIKQPSHKSGPTFETYSGFLNFLKDKGISINICGLVGHNTIRAYVMGMGNRQPNVLEMTSMKNLVAEAMRSGAVGISTGLVYPPGMYSKTAEIVELARVVAKRGGIYATHMRGEASTLVDSVAEALEIGRKAKLPVQISHHKAAGKENWGKTKQTLKMVEEANRKGQVVRVDVYPYRAGSAGLKQLVPPWAHEGGVEKMLERLKNGALRHKIAHDMTIGCEDWPNFFRIDWADIQIAQAATEKNQKWVGKTIADLAEAKGCLGVDACIDLLIEENAEVRMINFIMDENEVQRVLKHPLSIIGSDGRAVSPAISKGKPHPRYYGCFPRVLGHYCRDLKLFSLETAINKMTGMPAEQLALGDRGILKAGNAADITIFDFNKIIDKATFRAPHQYPAEIDSVIVNGQLVVHQGEHLGIRPGQILHSQRM